MDSGGVLLRGCRMQAKVSNNATPQAGYRRGALDIAWEAAVEEQ